MVQTATEAQKIVGQVSAMAMMDEGFKSRLTAAPAAVLAEHGLEMPADMRVEIKRSFGDVPVAERPANTLYLVVPEADELTQEELAMVVGAGSSCQSTASSLCTIPSCLSSSSTASTNSCS